MAELTRRYIVMPLATEGPFDRADPDAPFVLKPWKDPAALRALESYRDHCYPELARDLDEWIRTIRAAVPQRGGVGARNEPYVVSAGKARAAGTAKPARRRPKARSKVRRVKSVKKKGKRK